MKKIFLLLLTISTFSAETNNAQVLPAKPVKHAPKKKKEENLSLSKNKKKQKDTKIAPPKKATTLQKKDTQKPPALKFEDKIAVIIHVNPEHDPIVITHKELNRPSINGTPQSKEEVIKARKIEYEGVHVFKMPIPDEAITNYLRQLKEQHGMTEEQFKQKFELAGYSYQEGIDELRRMLIVDQLFNFKIKSRLVVPEADVRAYYNAHPQELPESYNIKQGSLSGGILTPQELVELKETGKHSNLVDWNTPFWLADEDMAASLAHIKELPEGSIAAVMPNGSGYDVIQLIKKRPKRMRTFEESYKEITEILQRPLFEKLVKEYEKELEKKYEVVYF